MSFKLSQQARSYFRDISESSTTGEFDTLWDQYYLCVMVGIKDRSRVPDDEEPSTEFSSEVIQAYDDQKYEIYSALIVAEIEREGIPWDGEEEIREMMMTYLSSETATRLTEHGTKALNCYAEKGFRLIRDEIPAPPELDEFLRAYHELLEKM
jgi:hypothetical protein